MFYSLKKTLQMEIMKRINQRNTIFWLFSIIFLYITKNNATQYSSWFWKEFQSLYALNFSQRKCSSKLWDASHQQVHVASHHQYCFIFNFRTLSSKNQFQFSTFYFSSSNRRHIHLITPKTIYPSRWNQAPHWIYPKWTMPMNRVMWALVRRYVDYIQKKFRNKISSLQSQISPRPLWIYDNCRRKSRPEFGTFQIQNLRLYGMHFLRLNGVITVRMSCRWNMVLKVNLMICVIFFQAGPYEKSDLKWRSSPKSNHSFNMNGISLVYFSYANLI